MLLDARCATNSGVEEVNAVLVLRTKPAMGCDGSALQAKKKTATAAPSNTGTAKVLIMI